MWEASQSKEHQRGEPSNSFWNHCRWTVLEQFAGLYAATHSVTAANVFLGLLQDHYDAAEIRPEWLGKNLLKKYENSLGIVDLVPLDSSPLSFWAYSEFEATDNYEHREYQVGVNCICSWEKYLASFNNRTGCRASTVAQANGQFNYTHCQENNCSSISRAV